MSSRVANSDSQFSSVQPPLTLQLAQARSWEGAWHTERAKTRPCLQGVRMLAGEPERKEFPIICGEISDASVLGLPREHRRGDVCHLRGLGGSAGAEATCSVWGATCLWSSWSLVCEVGSGRRKVRIF